MANPSAAPSQATLNRLPTGLWKHRELLQQLIARDIHMRYRGSALGILWSLLNPLFTLTVFAVVFGVIFDSKLTDQPDESKVLFALALFSALVTFNFFAEILGRSPSLIVLSPSYVTKVVFPLEVLPAAAVGAALVHLVISLVPLVAGIVILRGQLPWTIIQWPLLLLPLVCWSLATAWFCSALGVFVRDLQQVVGTATLALMYASAIFYRLGKVPEDAGGFPLRAVVGANPLAFIAESSRNLCLLDIPLDWGAWIWQSLAALGAMALARTFFRRTQHAFADVI